MPPLRQTLDRLLASIRAVTTDEEYAHSKACVDAFARNPAHGPRLQKLLEDRAQNSRNWLEEWWEEFAYLRARYPIATWINWTGASPAIDWSPYRVSQVEAAALFTRHLLLFRELVVSGNLQPDTLAGRKLDMYQYARMFNCCRIPGEECDRMEVYPAAGPSSAKHIVVLRNDRIVRMQVLDSETSAILPFADLARGFERCIELSSNLFDLDRAPAVSVLTSEERHIWAGHRLHLIALDPRNNSNLDAVESALFVVSLERAAPVSVHDRGIVGLLGRGASGWTTHDDDGHRESSLSSSALGAGHIHDRAATGGGGSGRGIWYDKPFTMMIFANGLGVINGEHTWADAMVVVRQQDWCVRSVRKELDKCGGALLRQAATSAPTAAFIEPELLHWHLDARILRAIETASVKIEKLNSTIEMAVLEFHHFGKAFCKRHNLTPDSFVQMAIQLAFYRLHGHPTPVYETGHTRLFYHGRTETVRTCSIESIRWCKAMCGHHDHGNSPDGDEENDDTAAAASAAHGEAGAGAFETAPDASMHGSRQARRRMKLLRQAIAAHGVTIKAAMTGEGIDRHLMGLQILATMDVVLGSTRDGGGPGGDADADDAIMQNGAEVPEPPAGTSAGTGAIASVNQDRDRRQPRPRSEVTPEDAYRVVEGEGEPRDVMRHQVVPGGGNRYGNGVGDEIAEAAAADAQALVNAGASDATLEGNAPIHDQHSSAPVDEDMCSDAADGQYSSSHGHLPPRLQSSLPPLFSDPGFLRSKRFTLSTSNNGVGEAKTFGAFSPFFSGGYSLSYGMQDMAMYVSVGHVRGGVVDPIPAGLPSSSASGSDLLDLQHGHPRPRFTDCYALRRELHAALVDMHALVCEVEPHAYRQYQGHGPGRGAKL